MPFLILLCLLALIVLLYLAFIRPWHVGWGARGDEAVRILPGDGLTPGRLDQYTRVVTIRAPAQAVWKWVVQIGQGRGGLYSYESLENLIGCDIHNVNEIRPELQSLHAGDKVRLGPEGYPFYVVEEAVPAHHLLLKSSGTPGDTHTWLFLIEPYNDAAETRLIVRSRGVYPPTIGQFFVWRVMTEPLHFIMERKMLLTFKALAEGK